MNERSTSRAKDILIIVLTAGVTILIFISNAFDQDLLSASVSYTGYLVEVNAVIIDAQNSQGNANLQRANWLNCLESKNAQNCNMISDLSNVEEMNKNQALGRLKDKGEKLNNAAEGYLVAQKWKNTYQHWFDWGVYIFTFLIIIVTIFGEKILKRIIFCIMGGSSSLP